MKNYIKKIFLYTALYFPISLLGQSQSEFIINKINDRINDTIPYKVIIKYIHNGKTSKDVKSELSTQYFKLKDTSKNDYLKYDYLVKNDTIIYYKKHKKIYAETRPDSFFGIGDYYKGWKTIENPLIFGVVLTDESDEIALDSINNNYNLKINLSKKNSQNILENSNSVSYEYTISKNDFNVSKVLKIIQTNEGILCSSLEFETEYLTDNEFNNILSDFFDNSLFMDLDEIIADQYKILYPQDSILNFSLNCIDGELINTYDGSTKLYLLDFWFVACGPCRLAMPYLDTIYQKYKQQGLTVIGLNANDKDTSLIKKVLNASRVSYPISMDALELIQKLKVQVYPTLILLNSRRKIIYWKTGFEKDEIKELDKLIAKELEK